MSQSSRVMTVPGIVLVVVAAVAAMTAVAVAAPPPRLDDPFLDRMAGTWVLRGTIEGRPTTHDVTAAWVLGHNYVRIREVSREKDAAGQPAYEAIVFVGREPKGEGYACLWLDNTGGGGLSAPAIGHGRRRGDAVEFLFVGQDGSRFHTTFDLAATDGSWQWRMDGESHGKLEPFARLRLTKE
jgi:hypothetical protein